MCHFRSLGKLSAGFAFGLVSTLWFLILFVQMRLKFSFKQTPLCKDQFFVYTGMNLKHYFSCCYTCRLIY